MAEIRWTYEAELWLKEIHDYIALDNPGPAMEVVDGICEAIEFHIDGLKEDGYEIPKPTSRSFYVEIAA